MARAITIQFDGPADELMRAAASRSSVSTTGFVRQAAVARVYFEMGRGGGSDAETAQRFIDAARVAPRATLKAAEVCRRLGVSKTWLYDLVRRGRIAHVR